MLVLARRIGEEIVIDGRIFVKVLGVRGDSIRLGVNAPAGVLIDRHEVHDRRSREAAEALFAPSRPRETVPKIESAPVS